MPVLISNNPRVAVFKFMISRQTISGFFYLCGLYLAYSHMLYPSMISMIGATILLRLKSYGSNDHIMDGPYHQAGKKISKLKLTKRIPGFN